MATSHDQSTTSWQQASGPMVPSLPIGQHQRPASQINIASIAPNTAESAYLKNNILSERPGGDRACDRRENVCLRVRSGVARIAQVC